MAESSSFDKVLRRFAPSISALTFNPFFKYSVNIADTPLRLLFREFRSLPPNHMRLRIGVGNRILTNQTRYLQDSVNFWIDAFANGRFRLDGIALEIGSGCGRYAHLLRDFRMGQVRFTGVYIGVDIDQEMLAWCSRHFDAERFRFHLSGDASSSYRNKGEQSAPQMIAEPDGSVDFVFSRSLFSHLLENQAARYLAESYRLLKPGGVASHTFFCIDFPPPTFGVRHTFSHQLGKTRVESLKQPEAAVAYSWADIVAMGEEAGFEDIRMYRNNSTWQPTVVFRKPDNAKKPATQRAGGTARRDVNVAP